jgi:hypothetical protein
LQHDQEWPLKVAVEEEEDKLRDSTSQPAIPHDKLLEPESNAIRVQAGNAVEHARVDDRSQAPRAKPNPDLPSGPEVLIIPGDPSEDSPREPQYIEFLNNEPLPKGPVAVEANLDPNTEKEPLISSPDQPVKEKIIETEPPDHLSLEEKADSLPEIVHIPFEDAVKDEVLQGWEDSWVAHATYIAKTWGKLAEPKIDFVYLCKRLHDKA